MAEKFMDRLKELLSVEGLIGLVVASAGIGYLLVQIDVIPDTIPVIGYFDDAFMVVLLAIGGYFLARKLLGKK
jgi:uncharacterized membrane protein YkvA (DUF1232 family)